MIEMQDHIAVITGAGSGFGEATALRLAREGMPIFCQDINEENAQRTAAKVREGNGRAEAIGGDVSNEADVKAMFAACRKAFGDCTLLFANAGYARLSPFVEMKTEDFDRMVAVLLRGVFLCDREALGPMLEKGEGGDHQHRLPARPQGSLPDGPLCGGEGRRHRAHEVTRA